MAKRYSIEYEDGKLVCGNKTHHWCDASALSTAKSIARRAAKEPDVIIVRVLDTQDEDENGYAPVVFQIS